MSSRRYNLRPLPGGRRGTPGAGAGCLSMQTTGDEELSRRALVDQDTTAELQQLNRRIAAVDATAEHQELTRRASDENATADQEHRQIYYNRSRPVPPRSLEPRRGRYLSTRSKGKHQTIPEDDWHEDDRERSQSQEVVNSLSNQTFTGASEYNRPSQSVCNTIEETNTPPATDVSQAASAMRPATTKAGKPSVRMKWNQDINIFIMRTYFQITKLETDLTQYRPILHRRFMEAFPNVDVSEQRLSDQRRVIVRNRLLSHEKIEQIRNEIRQDIQSIESNNSTFDLNIPNSNINSRNRTRSEDQSIITTLDTNYSLTPENNIHTNSLNTSQHNNCTQQTHNHHENTELTQKLTEELETNLTTYNDMDPTTRPLLPKIKTSRDLTNIITLFNSSILPSKLSLSNNITQTHTLIYCTALTIITYFNIKIGDRPYRGSTKSKPEWQVRLERDIEQLRQDTARLTQFKMGNTSKKLSQKVKLILQKYQHHSTYDNLNKKVDDHLDTLKQKLAVKSHRLARYKKAAVRKENNKLFTNNEKQFYRKLKGNYTNITNPPTKESLNDFWSQIWSNNAEHNKNTEWIDKEITRSNLVENMAFEDISLEEISVIINRTHNWKAAGHDKIHNFWIKRLNVFHDILAKQITDIIKGNSDLPDFLTKGITFMIPKSDRTEDPSQYRPITCLPTLYKIITACLANRINSHIEHNNLLSEEQKGCRRRHRGCKEQLIIDSTILKYAQKTKKDLYISYIDYKKAFDSVPHSWLLHILNIYRINPQIISFLEKTMRNWKTTLNIRTPTTNISTNEIAIKRGIFQGDSLSPLWFCLALNPLSRELIDSKIGFNIKSNRQTIFQLTHLLYMDDLKLYANKETEINKLLDITKTFSDDIKMDFGLDKCRKLNIKRGNIVAGTYTVNEEETIQAMENNELYKYLGYNQSRSLDHTQIRHKIKQEYFNRINYLCKMQLASRYLFKAINTYAIPILTYSFGIIKWSNTELQSIQIKTRTTLTQHRYHHPKSAKERVNIPRKEGGRGLIDISQLHKRQINNLKQFFKQKKLDSTLHKTITSIDKNYTPLNLSDEQPIETVDKVQLVEEQNRQWKGKELHGRHPHDLNQPHVDKEASNRWLHSGDLFPETEGFLIAIQDQVINTKNYRKYILKDTTLQNDLCRKCNNKPETIQHITGACVTLTQNDYTHRHNQLVNIVHQKLARKYKLLRQSEPHTPYYKYSPQAVMETSSYKLYYDRTIMTDHTIYNNRPDITLVDKANKHTYIIDIAVPNTNNIQSTIAEKIRKYTELQEEIKRVWKMNHVTIVPIILSTTGVIPKLLFKSLETLDLPKYTYVTLQKAAILNTCRIVRKFLQLDSTYQPLSFESQS